MAAILHDKHHYREGYEPADETELANFEAGYRDGLRHAGTLSGNPRYDPLAAMTHLLAENVCDPRQIADILLAEAVERDNGRPRDDISVLVAVVTGQQGDGVRRLDAHLPL